MYHGPLSNAAPVPPLTSRAQERQSAGRAADGDEPARHPLREAIATAVFNWRVRRSERDQDVDLMQAIEDAWLRKARRR
jgi:hypothetical protein